MRSPGTATRAAPAYPNERKPACSSEGMAQPKIHGIKKNPIQEKLEKRRGEGVETEKKKAEEDRNCC